MFALQPAVGQATGRHTYTLDLFIDYSGRKASVVDAVTGEEREAELYVAVLGASSYVYAEATWTQRLADL